MDKQTKEKYLKTALVVFGIVDRGTVSSGRLDAANPYSPASMAWSSSKRIGPLVLSAITKRTRPWLFVSA
jgi:hypothetical protein